MLKDLYIVELIKKNSNYEKESILTNREFVDIMKILDKNLEYMSCVNFVDDCRESIVKGLIENNLLKEDNFIVNYLNVGDITKDENSIEIMKALSEYSICMVVEPNKNIYMDIDYGELLNLFTTRFDSAKTVISMKAYIGIMLQLEIQKKAFISSENEFLESDVEEIVKKTIIDCNAEKDEAIFSYYGKALSNIGIKKSVCKKILEIDNQKGKK